MFQIEQYVYSNRLFSVHPGEKTAFALVTMVVCLASSSSAACLVSILLMAGSVVLLAGIACRPFLKLLAGPVSFLAVGAVTVAFSFSGRPEDFLYSFSLGGVIVGVSPGDAVLACLVFLKSLAATTCLFFLSLTTPMVEVISVLRKIRVPALFLELVGLIYRFIFVLSETAERIYTAQSSRLGYKNLKTGYSSMGQLAANLFISAYRRSQMLFTTMSARGYTGDIRVLETEYTVSVRNVIVIIAVELALVAVSLVDRGLGI